MADIKGEAHHMIGTQAVNLDGPTLTIGADEANIIVHALNSAHQSAVRNLERAAASRDMNTVANSIASIQEVEHVLTLAYQTTKEESQETIDGVTLGLMAPTPQDLGVMVNSLSSYKHKLDGALLAIKNGDYAVVDIAEGATLGEGEVALADYNGVKYDHERAEEVARKLARYIREAYPDVNQGSLDFFVMQAARNRKEWMAKDTGLPVGTVWDGMLSTASLLFGVEPEYLDAMVQAKNAGPLN